MSFLTVYMAMWLWNWQGFDQISVRNLALKQAEQAYVAGNYKRAAEHYSFLLETDIKANPLIRLNLGHSLFRLKEFSKARRQYEQVIKLDQSIYLATATTQLGVIACYERDSAAALGYFKQAMLTDPEDRPARYNYELVKRLYSGKNNDSTKTKRPPKPKPQTQPRTQQANPEVAKTDEQKDVLRRLRNLNMTEEQAMQLLNAMRDDDLPYELARRRQSSPSKGKMTQRW